MINAGPTRRRAVGIRPLLMFVLTVWVIGVAEFVHVPSQLLRAPVDFVYSTGYVIRLLFAYGHVPLAYVGLIGLMQSDPIRTRARPRLRVIAHLLLAAAVAFHAYGVLVRDVAFRDQIAFPLLFCAYAVFLAVAGLCAAGLRGGGWRRLLHVTLPVVTLGAGVSLEVLNYLVEPHAYPTFHYAAVLVATTLIGSGFVQVAGRGWTWLPRRRWASAGLVVLASVPLLVGAWPLQEEGLKIRRYVRARTALGQGRLLSIADAQFPSEPKDHVVDPDGVARFGRHHHLPPLAPDFRVDDYNVVLITIETLRGDATSMADPERDLTPNLARFGDEGAFVYSRAYAPSSGTLQSISSIMAMRPPAAAPIELYHTWKGRLRSQQLTVAEILMRAGWTTFAVIHNHRKVFSRRIHGLTQGFAELDLVLEDYDEESARTIDARITGRVLERLADPESSRSPFFGWVFFAGPHHPYVEYPAQGEAKNRRARYDQEVRNTDAQLGQLLDGLRDQGRLRDTIVVIAGDHGEEFHEHGGRLHAGTLYEEVVHVPLVIWIPGTTGTVVDDPVSLTYVLPWLLATSEDRTVHGAVGDALRGYLGPVLRATEGAVLIELVGKSRHFSALVDGQLKLVYDHVNELFEGYDLESDPAETVDLILEGDPRFDSLLERFEAYRQVMLGYEQYNFVGPMPSEEDDGDDDDADEDTETTVPSENRPKKTKRVPKATVTTGAREQP